MASDDQGQRAEHEALARDLFGYDKFRDLQWDVMRPFLRWLDRDGGLDNGGLQIVKKAHAEEPPRILLVAKTAFGKSLCYQYPALRSRGLTIVISPLIALMRDQASRLAEIRGPECVGCIHSGQTQDENVAVMRRALDCDDFRLLYICPERLDNLDFRNAFETPLQRQVTLVAIDEAHCISQWGHDFRPDYQKIQGFLKLLEKTTRQKVPVLGLTATAPSHVVDDIKKQMGATDMQIVRGNSLRANLELHVERFSESAEDKQCWLAANMGELVRFANRVREDGGGGVSTSSTGVPLRHTGIVFAGTRTEAETTAAWLEFCNKSLRVKCYHAGLADQEREDLEREFRENKWDVLVATNALGMGIDKPDVGFVVHSQLPQSVVHYYQEIGRGGRDGRPTPAVLLFDESRVVPIRGESASTSDSFWNDVGPGVADLELPKHFVDSAFPPWRYYEDFLNAVKSNPLPHQEIMRKANLKDGEAKTIRGHLEQWKLLQEAVAASKRVFQAVESGTGPSYNSKKAEFEKYAEARREHGRTQLDAVYRYATGQSSEGGASRTATCAERHSYLAAELGEHPNSGAEGQGASLTSSFVPTAAWEEFRSRWRDFEESFFPVVHVEKSAKPEEAKYRSAIRFLSRGRSKETPTLQKNTTFEIRQGEWRIHIKVDLLRTRIIQCIEEGNAKYYELTSSDAELRFDQIGHEAICGPLCNGVAASYYGNSRIGRIVNRLKYGGSDETEYPDDVVQQVARAFLSKFSSICVDAIVFVPPSVSCPALLENFAQRLSRELRKCGVRGDLEITSPSLAAKAQGVPVKDARNALLKEERAHGRFSFLPEQRAHLQGKTVILFDDVCDSGTTIRHVGKSLADECGAAKIIPLVIAQTAKTF
eukprot:g9417.t1